MNHKFLPKWTAACDKVSLDIFWLRDDTLEDSNNLPAPDNLAAEIVADLEAALEQFREIASDQGLKGSEVHENYSQPLLGLLKPPDVSTQQIVGN